MSEPLKASVKLKAIALGNRTPSKDPEKVTGALLVPLRQVKDLSFPGCLRHPLSIVKTIALQNLCQCHIDNIVINNTSY